VDDRAELDRLFPGVPEGLKDALIGWPGGFSFACGAAIYYGSLADLFPEFACEQVAISRSNDDGLTWANPV
jgi:hypothetical protein